MVEFNFYQGQIWYRLALTPHVGNVRNRVRLSTAPLIPASSMAERSTVNRNVRGSSPRRGASQDYYSFFG
jgi:hypothetical protein